MSRRQPPTGTIFWISLVIGWTVMLFGVAGALRDGRTAPSNFALWFAGSALAHDFLLAPAVFAVGFTLARLVPAPARRAVFAGLVVAGPVVVVALPMILSPGVPGNRSALPRNYFLGLMVILFAIAAITMVLAWRKSVRSRLPGTKESG